MARSRIGRAGGRFQQELASSNFPRHVSEPRSLIIVASERGERDAPRLRCPPFPCSGARRGTFGRTVMLCTCKAIHQASGMKSSGSISARFRNRQSDLGQHKSVETVLEQFILMRVWVFVSCRRPGGKRDEVRHQQVVFAEQRPTIGRVGSDSRGSKCTGETKPMRHETMLRASLDHTDNHLSVKVFGLTPALVLE